VKTIGDSRQMNLLADESVHLVVTSPSYWQLKDYGTNEQADAGEVGRNKD
jgi:DNA modification methylase